MDTSLSFTFSREDFLLFHKLDRDLYKILVTNLSLDPYKSSKLLAMWLWLEKVGFQDVVKKIVSLPVILIDEIVVESMMCLACITNNNNTSQIEKLYYEENDIPLIQSLMDKEISLKFFLENRVEAVRGVEKTEQEVCMRALSDIMQQAIMRNMMHRMMNNNNFLFGSIGPANLQFGSVRIDGATAQQQNNNSEGRGREIIPAEDRTLFVTFSKGCHVEEWEVKNFFTTVYGDCIEALFMQKTAPNEQALFARIVLHKVDTIDMILRGHSKAKFFINGKHIWARKFVPKRVNISKVMLPGETSGFGSGFGM